VLKVNRKKERCKGAKPSTIDHLISHSKHTISIQYFKFAHLRLTLLCLSWDHPSAIINHIMDPRTAHDIDGDYIMPASHHICWSIRLDT
jgi:hypothetical protein